MRDLFISLVILSTFCNGTVISDKVIFFTEMLPDREKKGGGGGGWNY